MKKFLVIALFALTYSFQINDLFAQYISSTTMQTGNSFVYPGQTNAMVMRIEIEIGGLPLP